MDKLINKTTLVSLVFFFVAMGLLVYFSLTRQINISNVVTDEVSENRNDEQTTTAVTVDDNNIIFGDNSENSEYLCIPLPDKTVPEDITIENHYMDKELHVVIQGVGQTFFEAVSISGNHSKILKGTYEPVENGMRICLDMNGIYEYKTVFENNALYISFLNPREVYEKIVVIDPGYGGRDLGDQAGDLTGKSISLSVAQKIRQALENEDIKIYYTRMDDVNPSSGDRVALANDIKADMYIRIETDSKEDDSVYGVTTVYNGEYFIPGFGNVELSDIMEKAVVTAVKGKALGLISMDDGNDILRNLTVPAATIKVGCLTNKQEAILLGREDYMEKIADGILNGIYQAYEDMGK